MVETRKNLPEWSLYDLFLGDDDISNKSRRLLGFKDRRGFKTPSNNINDLGGVGTGQDAVANKRSV